VRLHKGEVEVSAPQMLPTALPHRGEEDGVRKTAGREELYNFFPPVLLQLLSFVDVHIQNSLWTELLGGLYCQCVISGQRQPGFC